MSCKIIRIKKNISDQDQDQVISIPSDIRMITQLIGIPLKFRVKKTREVNSLGNLSYNIQPSNQMKGTAVSIRSRTANFSAEEVVDIIKNWATTSPSVIQNLTQDNTEEMQSYKWGQNILLEAEYTLRLRSATRGDEMKMGISVSTECGGKVNNCDYEVVISSNKDVIRFHFLEDGRVGMNFDISTARFMVMLGPGGNDDLNFSTDLKKQIINREKKLESKPCHVHRT